MIRRYLYQTLNLSFVPLTGLLLWPVLSRYLEDDLFAQLLIANALGAWIVAISGFGLTTRGVTMIATSTTPPDVRYQFFLLNALFALAALPLVAIVLILQGTSFGLICLLLAFALFVPTQLDWADHGKNNYRRPLMKNAGARIASIVILTLLIFFDVTHSVALSAALLMPLIAANLIVYRRWLQAVMHRGLRGYAIWPNLNILLWPGLQRVVTSTYANLDVIMVPLFFVNAQGAALLYIYRLLKAALGFLLGGITSFLPRLAQQAAGLSTDQPLPMSAMFFGVAVIIGAIILSLRVLEDPVLHLLGADTMANSSAIFRIIVFALLPMTLNNLIVNMMLYPRKKEGTVLITTLIVIIGVVVIFPFCTSILYVVWLFLAAEITLFILNSFIAWRGR